jgi:hypothetical protein
LEAPVLSRAQAFAGSERGIERHLALIVLQTEAAIAHREALDRGEFERVRAPGGPVGNAFGAAIERDVSAIQFEAHDVDAADQQREQPDGNVGLTNLGETSAVGITRGIADLQPADADFRME